MVYLAPELLHQVKTVALAERKTLQEIGVEALQELVGSCNGGEWVRLKSGARRISGSSN